MVDLLSEGDIAATDWRSGALLLPLECLFLFFLNCNFTLWSCHHNCELSVQLAVSVQSYCTQWEMLTGSAYQTLQLKMPWPKAKHHSCGMCKALYGCIVTKWEGGQGVVKPPLSRLFLPPLDHLSERALTVPVHICMLSCPALYSLCLTTCRPRYS